MRSLGDTKARMSADLRTHDLNEIVAIDSDSRCNESPGDLVTHASFPHATGIVIAHDPLTRGLSQRAKVTVLWSVIPPSNPQVTTQQINTISRRLRIGWAVESDDARFNQESDERLKSDILERVISRDEAIAADHDIKDIELTLRSDREGPEVTIKRYSDEKNVRDDWTCYGGHGSVRAKR